MRRGFTLLALVCLVALTAALQTPEAATASSSAIGLGKLKHLVFIMQENRSFDEYFGTFPGANGIPRDSRGRPIPCLPDPEAIACVRPYHDTNDRDEGGPHSDVAFKGDVNGVKMDGFIATARAAGSTSADVMGYRTAQDIPNYWAWARNFVLQDAMFSPSTSWSLPAHLYLVSGWSANCRVAGQRSSCVSDLLHPDRDVTTTVPAAYLWTDITYLLHKRGISWRYYFQTPMPGATASTADELPDCVDPGAIRCPDEAGSKGPSDFWNPLPDFQTVQDNRQVGNVQNGSHFYEAAAAGRLPAVSWVVPNGGLSDHAPASITNAHNYVTALVNAVMRSPNWSSTAIFISWDEWGGFYDHVLPPNIDGLGYGIRVPGLVISPYARHGLVDHQRLSHDAYLKFIEDVFLGGQRLDPATDGRPDPRPTVRERAVSLGDLRADFDFTQAPRAAMPLPPHAQRRRALRLRAASASAPSDRGVPDRAAADPESRPVLPGDRPAVPLLRPSPADRASGPRLAAGFGADRVRRPHPGRLA